VGSQWQVGAPAYLRLIFPTPPSSNLRTRRRRVERYFAHRGKSLLSLSPSLFLSSCMRVCTSAYRDRLSLCLYCGSPSPPSLTLQYRDIYRKSLNEISSCPIDVDCLGNVRTLFLPSSGCCAFIGCLAVNTQTTKVQPTSTSIMKNTIASANLS
jgi:hypothetical protein